MLVRHPWSLRSLGRIAAESLATVAEKVCCWAGPRLLSFNSRFSAQCVQCVNTGSCLGRRRTRVVSLRHVR